MITHGNDKQYGTIYHATKLGVSNHIIYPIPASSTHIIHKGDQRHINQYNATNQLKYTTQHGFEISAILGKSKKKLTTPHFRQ